jgi:hypothetical protein
MASTTRAMPMIPVPIPPIRSALFRAPLALAGAAGGRMAAGIRGVISRASTAIPQ